MKSNMSISNNIPDDKVTLDTYLDEYNIVTGKITSLSMKFASGSYIIPISLVVGAVSISFENVFIYTIAMMLPIVLFLYIYNHIRYMALQFKLSGYAKHLEERINEIVGRKSGEQILLWENTIARGNEQNYFEGFFLGITYFLLFLLTIYFAYHGLITVAQADMLPFFVTALIAFIYFFSFFSIIFFLIFFTKEHDRSYFLAKTASKGHDNRSSIKKGNNRVSKRSFFVKILIAVIIIALFPISLEPLIHYSVKNTDCPLGTYDYVVILGNKSHEGYPSDDMRSRLNCFLSHMSNNDKYIVLLSGGNGEATLMKSYLEQNNVQQTISLETQSSSTYQNFLHCKEMISGKVLVITSDYHLFRCALISKELGVNCDFLGADTVKKSSFCMSIILECYKTFGTTLSMIFTENHYPVLSQVERNT